jgi:hypothetical protein
MPNAIGTTSIIGVINIPTAGLGDAHMSANSPLSPSKVQHQFPVAVELFPAATTVTALTKDFYIGYGSTGTIVAFTAAINGAIATGADRTVTVDLQKSTSGGAFATVLSSTIGFTNASVLRTPVSGTINSPAYSALDEFRVVVSVAGSASAQATGLIVRAVFSEMPS